MKFFDGKKTYIAAALFIVLAGLKALGYVDESTYQTLLAVAGGLGLYGLRKAI